MNELRKGLSVLERLQVIADLQHSSGKISPARKDPGECITKKAPFDTSPSTHLWKLSMRKLMSWQRKIGHSVMGGGDLLFPGGVDPVVKLKAELGAKQYAYNLVLPVIDLLKSMKEQMNINEIADCFCVTPCFVKEAIAVL